MTTEEWNALLSVSRNAYRDIQAEWKRLGIDDTDNKKLIGARDDVNRRILSIYENKVHPRFTRIQIVWGIGYLRGVLRGFG